MVERFSWDQVNHYLWRRQRLAWDQKEKSRHVLESLIGIYATAPTSYLTVLARDADFRWWSGLSKEEADSAFTALSGEIVPIRIDGAEHWLLAARLDDLRNCPAELPQGVRLLPVWDAYLMAYKDRWRYLPEAWYDSVYAKTGDATST